MKQNSKTPNLREVGALSPGVAVVAEDGGGGQILTVDLAHQVIVDVRLPRHLSLSLSFLSLSLNSASILRGLSLFDSFYLSPILLSICLGLYIHSKMGIYSAHGLYPYISNMCIISKKMYCFIF